MDVVTLWNVDENVPPDGSKVCVYNEPKKEWVIMEYMAGWRPLPGKERENPFRPTKYIVLPD